MQISDTVKSIETLIGSLKDLKTGINDTINSTNNNKLKENVDNSAKTINTLKKALNFGVAFAGIKKGWSIVKDVAMANINMVETNNLFEVSMGKVVDQYGNLDEAQSQYYTKALAFQDEMNEKLLTNKAELKEFQAMYYTMFKSQGINKDTSYLMSESLTKAGYDIASLYNLSVDDAMSKLRSGIAGQVEPLRKIGVDISESSLQRVLDSAGIDRTVQQLSYAEKEVARYIAIMNQAGQAQGDFAKTMDSSANQIKVFKNQVAELKQVAGAFIMNVFGNILVYVNAIIMVVKEILKSFAALFGFNLDLGGGVASLGGVSDTVDNIGSGLGKASKNAKELKKQLMGFDEINNIDPASNSGSSGGGGGGISGGGIDDKLLNSLKEWDNMMDSISGKAQAIRDKILDWLGVTDGSYNNLKKIWEVVKAIGLGFATWKIASSVMDLLKNLNIFKGNAFQMAFGMTLAVTGISLLWNGTKRLLKGDVDLFSILETIGGGAMSTFGIANMLRSINNGKTFTWGKSLLIGLGITLAIQGVQVLLDGIETGDIKKQILGALELTASLGTTLYGIFGNKLISGIKTAWANIQIFGTMVVSSFRDARASGLSFGASLLTAGKDAGSFIGTGGKLALGLAGIAAGSVLSYKGMKDLTLGTKDTTAAMIELGAGIGAATLSGAAAGAQFGTVGAIVGGIAGLVTSGITAWMGYRDAIAELGIPTTTLTEEIKELIQEVDNNIKAHDDAINSIKKTCDEQLVEADYAERLSNQLKGLVDSNGKVIAGNEERVDFILGELSNALGMEISRNGDVIVKNGEVVTSYEELQRSIAETVKAKKKEAEQAANIELYRENIKKQIQLEREKDKLKAELAKAEVEYDQLMAKGYSQWTLEHNEDCKKILQNYTDLSSKLNETRDDYWKTTEDVNHYSQKMTEDIVDNTGILSREMYLMEQVSTEKLKELVNNNTQTWENCYNELTGIQQAGFLAQSTGIDNWSPVLQEKWTNLANTSAENFANGLATVDSDTQAKIISSITVTEGLTPTMSKAWSDLANKSFEDFSKGLDQVEPNLRDEIIRSITTTEGLTPTMIQTWSSLASRSEEEFNRALDPLDDDVKGQIVASMIAVDGLNDSNRRAYENLSSRAKQGFNNAMNGMDSDARSKVQSAINEINGQSGQMYNAGYNDGRSAREGADAGQNSNGGSSAIGNWFVQGLLNALTGGKFSIWQAGYNLVRSAINGGNSAQRTGSPAKETIKMGNFFTEGYIIGLKQKQEEIRKVAENLVGTALNEFDKVATDGILINDKDFSINANEYVDYSAINGQIQTQSTVDVNDNLASKVADASYKAFIQAMKDEGIKIEAKTEEGVIVQKASQGFTEHVMQTGELPFPVPV